MSVTLSAMQERAVFAARDWWRAHDEPVFYLGGYAGSGKTTILPQIVEATGVSPDKVAFCAPTAKAAMVMSSKLDAFGFKQKARTLHHCMYIPRSLSRQSIEGKISYLKEQLSLAKVANRNTDGLEAAIFHWKQTLDDLEGGYRDALGFIRKPEFHSEECPFPELVIVDEASMVGTSIGTDLLNFGIPVIAIGDPGQLQPVKDKAFLTAGKPSFFLDEIHRQALDSPIIRLSTMAREGKRLPLGKMGDDVLVVKDKDDETTLADRDMQVICGRHKTRWALTDDIRDVFGYSDSGPEQGEPLMVVQNNYIYPGFINGYPVVCAKSVGDLNDGEATYRIDVETMDGSAITVKAFQPILEEHMFTTKGYCSCEKEEAKKQFHKAVHLDFNWVTTCHKAQGSEWDEVCLHDESRVWRKNNEHKEWLYTGITRAKERLTVVVPNNY